MKANSSCFLLFILLTASVIYCQNETKRWHFGNYAALNFMSSPPAILASSSMSVTEGCSSIADASGNLLFYTNGNTVWNQSNAVMANGTALSGSNTPTQSSVIVKKPGSNGIYYIFTVGGVTVSPGLCYSIVNMSLSAGMGSVTAKNTVLYIQGCKEKIAATKHCNGTDVWIVVVDAATNNFRSYLLTSAGITMPPVISFAGPTASHFAGCMKLSPNGKKLGNVHPSGIVELYDFDNSSGSISNQLVLESNAGAYGCEFSPDGSKFYCTGEPGFYIRQWNICAGAPAAILASVETFTSTTKLYSMQLAPDKKIYVARNNQQSLGVINNPNVTGTGCNFVEAGQSINPRSSFWGLPNFMSTYFRTPTPAFTYTISPAASCQTVAFSSPYNPLLNCAASGNSVVSLFWDFGDPLGAGTNTSTAFNPVHVYSGTGTFVPTLVVNYNCYSDTIQQVVVISGPLPQINITGNAIICRGQTATLTASGANSYTWSNGFTNASIIASPANTNTYSVMASHQLNSCISQKSITLYVYPCTSVDEQQLGSSALIAYPNPVSSELTIECSENLHVIIFDVLGKQVSEEMFSKGKRTVSMDNYQNGIYLLKFNGPSGSGTVKLLKTD